MKNYVVDTSVAVKWFIVQPNYQQAIELLDLIIHDHTHLLKGALNLATKYKRSVYDSIFMYLSNEIEAVFITSDEKLVNAVSKELAYVKLLQNIKIIDM